VATRSDRCPYYKDFSGCLLFVDFTKLTDSAIGAKRRMIDVIEPENKVA
jgi:hypothetical protein